MDYFNSLPKELIFIIISESNERYNLMLTSKTFYNYASDNQVWINENGGEYYEFAKRTIRNSITTINNYKFRHKLSYVLSAIFSITKGKLENGNHYIRYCYVDFDLLINKEPTNKMKKGKHAIVTSNDYNSLNCYIKSFELDIPSRFYVDCFKNIKLINCYMYILSDSVGRLKSLKSLVLYKNKIGYLPSEIGYLDNLELLDISYNHIQFIPISIGNLANLKMLFLSNNKITEIPTSIGKLKNLQVLLLSKNKIKEIPNQLFQLPNLERINLKSNLIETIPKTQFNLPKIKKIDLRFNKIKTVPKKLTSLPIKIN